MSQFQRERYITATMAILLKPVLVLFLLCDIWLIPCMARFSNNRGPFEPFLEIGEWRNSVHSIATANLYSKVQGVWNASWPSIIAKLKQESLDKHGFSTAADRLQSLSKPCSDDLLRLVYGLSELDIWAWEMVDASGKPPTGLLLGNIHWLGMYDQCLDVSSKESQTQQLDNRTIVGKYCLVSIGPDPSASAVPMKLDLGICIPQRCNSTDAKALFNQVLILVTDEVSAFDADCSDGSALPLDSGAIAIIAILCVLVALLVLGTCLDVIRNHCLLQVVVVEQATDDKGDNGDVSALTNGDAPMRQHDYTVQRLDTNGCFFKFLIAFSVLTNAKKIFSLETQQTNKNLDALNGIRFLSMTWVILHHTYIFVPLSASNVLEYFNLIERFTFQPVVNGQISVEAFFVLSGTLGAFSLLKDIRDKNGPGSINWPKFFFHRFWRLTPLYMVVLAIYATLFKYMGSGPFWKKESDEFCKLNWWTNLLYINNIVHNDSICMTWSWYLANDMQFFLLMPIFVALLYKWPVLGVIVTFISMLTSSITTGVITYVNEYPPGLPGAMQNLTSNFLYMQHVYYAPWCRINPYLIGILLGYILYKTNFKLSIHRALVVFGWCLAVACSLSLVYGLYNVSRGFYLSPSLNALYNAVQRTTWSICVSWVILTCATGNCGFVNGLLSLKVMMPLARLTYAAYLINQIMILWYYQNLKAPVFISDITMVYMFFGHLFLSYIFAFVLSIACEVPMINLEQSFLRNRRNQN